MADQDHRQREAERDAQQLGRRQAEGASVVDRPQRQQEMGCRRAVEQHRARQAGPHLDRDLEARFGDVERDEAERVVGEMRPDIGEKNETGCHAQVPARCAGRQS